MASEKDTDAPPNISSAFQMAVRTVMTSCVNGQNKNRLALFAFLEKHLPKQCVLSTEGLQTFVKTLLDTCLPWKYLEIGVFSGSTLFYAIHNHAHARVCGVDDWSQSFDVPDDCIRPQAEFIASLSPRASLISKNCWDIASEDVESVLDGKPNVLLYDAGHTRDEQRRAVEHFWPLMDDEFVFIVDDWKTDGVMDGTYDGIHSLRDVYHVVREVAFFETRTILVCKDTDPKTHADTVRSIERQYGPCCNIVAFHVRRISIGCCHK